MHGRSAEEAVVARHASPQRGILTMLHSPESMTKSVMPRLHTSHASPYAAPEPTPGAHAATSGATYLGVETVNIGEFGAGLRQH